TDASQFDDATHMGKFMCRPFIRQDLAGVTRTLLRMDDLRQNFYRVVASSKSTYMKDSPVAQRKLPKQQLHVFKPWDMSLSYYHRSDRGREVMMGAEPGIEMTSPAHILWIDLACAPETSTGPIHYVIGWLGVGERRLLVYDPLMEEEEFQMREPAAQSRASSTWSALCRRAGSAPRHCLSHVVRPAAVPNPSEDERAPESPIDLLDSSKEAPLEGDRAAGTGGSPARSFDEVPDEVTPAIDITEEAVVTPMSPIRSVGGGGRVGSVGKTPGVSEDVGRKSPIISTRSGCEVFVTARRAGAAVISESVSIVPVAHSLRSFSHINLPLSTVSDLLFSGGGVDDLNVDKVDRPLGLPGADASILSGSFFALASPGYAKRSPSSVHRASSSSEGECLFPTA
ncbi:hypothetical protein ACLOJK_034812, partial [Asimina triloba]